MPSFPGWDFMLLCQTRPNGYRDFFRSPCCFQRFLCYIVTKLLYQNDIQLTILGGILAGLGAFLFFFVEFVFTLCFLGRILKTRKNA